MEVGWKGYAVPAACAAAAAAWWWATKPMRRLLSSDSRQGTWGAQAALIGETPLIWLRSLSELCPGCQIWAKAEQLNPTGTGKDRIALAMLRAAVARGELPQGGGGIVVEGSSGSTAIALAPLAVAAGHRMVAVLPDDVSKEKLHQLQHCPGVTTRVVRAASIASPRHYVNEARRIAKELRAKGEQATCTNQFENPANWQAHYDGTGREIWRQTGGRLSAFVMSAGTGGTIAGVSRFLKRCSSKIAVYLADPQGSSLHARVRHGVCYAAQQREQSMRRHRYDTIVDGVGLDRVTTNFLSAAIDDALIVSDADALVVAHYLQRYEGLFLGSSSALNCLAAVRVANELKLASPAQAIIVVTVLCDSGHRYFSRFWNRTWAVSRRMCFPHALSLCYCACAGDFVESRGLIWPPEDPSKLRQAAKMLAMRHPNEPALRPARPLDAFHFDDVISS